MESWETGWEVGFPASNVDELLLALVVRDLVHGASFDVEAVEDGTEIAAPLFKKAEELGIIVTIHTGAGDYGKGCNPLQVGLVAEQFPKIPIIMDHSGYGPGFNRFYAAVRVAKKNDNVYLGTTRVKAKWIKFLVEGAGAERVVFGSNGPEAMAMGDTPVWWVNNLKKANLTDNDFELVAWRNLARILKINES